MPADKYPSIFSRQMATIVYMFSRQMGTIIYLVKSCMLSIPQFSNLRALRKIFEG